MSLDAGGWVPPWTAGGHLTEPPPGLPLVLRHIHADVVAYQDGRRELAAVLADRVPELLAAVERLWQLTREDEVPRHPSKTVRVAELLAALDRIGDTR